MQEISLDVYNEEGQYIGNIEIATSNAVDIPCEDMPQELEINGIVYTPQF